MRLNYSACASIESAELALMGGGMGNSSIHEPLRIMYSTELIDAAVLEAQALINKDIQKALDQGRVIKTLTYTGEIVSSVEDGPAALVKDGAYVLLTATVEYFDI